jgi:hypothetical protein
MDAGHVVILNVFLCCYSRQSNGLKVCRTESVEQNPPECARPRPLFSDDFDSATTPRRMWLQWPGISALQQACSEASEQEDQTMTMTFVRSAVLAASVALAAAAGGCAPSSGPVPNPTYQAWSAFEPNSSVTLEGTRKSGEQIQKVQVIQRLLERSGDRIVLVLDGNGAKPPVITKKVEPAMIDPMDNPRTRPEAQVKDLGTEDVQVKGRTYTCRVKEVQVHVAFKEPLPSTEDLLLRTSVNAEIPGGTVKMFLQRKSGTHSMELSAQAIDFQAVRGNKQ